MLSTLDRNDATTLAGFPRADLMREVTARAALEPRLKKLAALARKVSPVLQAAAAQGKDAIRIASTELSLNDCEDARFAAWLCEQGYEAACGIHGLFVSWRERP